MYGVIFLERSSVRLVYFRFREPGSERGVAFVSFSL
jgi:hypothetical protein